MRVFVTASPDEPKGPSREPCHHSDLESLGSEGNAHYYRCNSCGDSLVEQGGRMWSIPGGPPSSRLTRRTD